jgi:hypothetical protein
VQMDRRPDDAAAEGTLWRLQRLRAVQLLGELVSRAVSSVSESRRADWGRVRDALANGCAQTAILSQ